MVFASIQGYSDRQLVYWPGILVSPNLSNSGPKSYNRSLICYTPWHHNLSVRALSLRPFLVRVFPAHWSLLRKSGENGNL